MLDNKMRLLTKKAKSCSFGEHILHIFPSKTSFLTLFFLAFFSTYSVTILFINYI
jgi:hypothetical protein